MPFEIGHLSRLELGYVGESGSREIQIDMREWLERWPDGGIAVDVLKPGRKEYYLADTKVKDGILTWYVTETDVAKAGRGLAQIRIYDFRAGTVYMSRVVETIIRSSIDMEEDLEAPHPMDTWVARAVEAKEGALNAEKSAEEWAKRAEQAAAYNGYMDFVIDEDGHLIYTRTDNVDIDFAMDEGRLTVSGNNG